VLVHIWWEFGRRAAENGDSRTDHGAAGTGFIVGARASGQMVGEFPGLQSALDQDGNLSATSDFRGVYSALLEQCRDPAGRRVQQAEARRMILGAPPARPPARVQVVAQEFSYSLSRTR
jgi:uncharacterized protein (DUF1501 family)